MLSLAVLTVSLGALVGHRCAFCEVWLSGLDGFLRVSMPLTSWRDQA